MTTTKILFFLIALVVVLWLGALLLITHFIPSWTERGQFGDLFGAVNALFSGLAFAGLFFTIYLQREELALQREELRLTREEMKGSREQLTTQARAQQALFYATVAQVKTASIQAEIEAIKMESEQMPSHARNSYWNRIHSASERILKISTDLEVSNKNS